MIGVSAADGNPYTSLPEDNNRSMMSSSFTIGIDSKGGFMGVTQGRYICNSRMEQEI